MPPVISIVGYSKSGKTTLIEKLLPELTRRGFRIGTVKHAPHGFDMDQQGKDGSRHQLAGAEMTILAGPDGLALFKKGDGAGLTLDRLQGYFSDMDLVISEGYKQDNKPKIAVIAAVADPPPINMDDDTLFAVYSDSAVDTRLPVFKAREVDRLAELIVSRFLSGDPAFGSQPG